MNLFNLTYKTMLTTASLCALLCVAIMVYTLQVTLDTPASAFLLLFAIPFFIIGGVVSLVSLVLSTHQKAKPIVFTQISIWTLMFCINSLLALAFVGINVSSYLGWSEKLI